MSVALKEKLRLAANTIQTACHTVAGGSEGNCKNASVAFALYIAGLGESVAISQGILEIDGEPHPHCWCRVCGIVVDVTSDQYAQYAWPFVEEEADSPQYKEEPMKFLGFSPSTAKRILAWAESHAAAPPI